jgi:membrane protein
MKRLAAFAGDVASFARFVVRRWREDRCPQIAGSLTYSTLLALVPAFAVVVALLAPTPFFAAVMKQVKAFVMVNLNPAVAERVVGVYMEQFAQHAARLTWIGVAVVFAVAIWLLLTMDRALNTIWRAHRSRPYWKSILLYAGLLVMGPLLVGFSMSITTYLVSLSATFGGPTSHAHAVLLRLWPVTLTALAFFLLYRLVPHRKVSPRHALLGAVVAAVLFESAKEGFADYVRHAPTYNVVYGTFATVPIFLVWIYLSWLIILFGAELTAAAAYWRDRAWKRAASGSARFREAIAVAQSLLEAQPAEVSFDRLVQATGLDARDLDETLAQLVNGGIVTATGGGYALMPEAVSGLANLRIAAAPAPAADSDPGGSSLDRVRTAKRGKARSARSSR